jgi:SAM-dependent methyltransferase
VSGVASSRATWELVTSCDVCGSTKFEEAFERVVDGAPLVRCVDCGLVILSPRPRSEDVTRWYESGYFTGDDVVSLGEGYLANAEAGIRHGTEHFFQLARRERLRGRRLLEVGVGGCAFLVQCRLAGALVSGLDTSAFAVQRARETYSLDVRVGTADATDFAPESFDLVAFTDVLEHVPSPMDFMKGVRRLLVPGGVLFGVAPNVDCVAHYGAGWAGLRSHPEHLYYFGKDSLGRLLKAAGLAPTEVWTHGEPSEPCSGEGRAVAPGASTGWKEQLRRVRGVMPVVRAVRRSVHLLSPAHRKARKRYRAGLGHDLYFRARRPR